MKNKILLFLSCLCLVSFFGCDLFEGSSGSASYNSNSSNVVASVANPYGDNCQKTTSGGSTCGLGEYCDITDGHPYKCLAQPCVGDNNCLPNQTQQDGSVIGYQCITSSYINSCEQYVVSGPTNSITCPTGQSCTLTNGAGTNSGVCANNTCGCSTPVQCATGYFCKIATKTCVAYTPNECTNTANLASDNCDALYYSSSTFQFYCDPNAPTRCRRLIEVSGSNNYCKKDRWCQTGWCYYAQNADPTAEPPDPTNLTEMGYCRAKNTDGSLGLNLGEKCTNSNQCTGSSGMACLSSGVCGGVLGSACNSTTPASNADCVGGIWVGHNGVAGCNNNNSLCVSGLCFNLTNVTNPGYYCVGDIGAACTTEHDPSGTNQGASTECKWGVCMSSKCGIISSSSFHIDASLCSWCQSGIGCNHPSTYIWYCR